MPDSTRLPAIACIQCWSKLQAQQGLSQLRFRFASDLIMAAGAAAAGDASSMMDPEQYGIKEFEKYEMVKFLGEGQFAEVVQYVRRLLLRVQPSSS